MTLRTHDVSVIVPAERTNLCTNPSYEIDLTGWSLWGHASTAIARSTSQSRRGVASLAVTPVTNQISGAFFSLALTQNVQYTFSIDVLDVAGITYSIHATDAAINYIGTTTWSGTGYWKRKALTFYANATANFYFVVTRAATASVAPFYIDGALAEVGVQSTYLDGDMKGFIVGETAYRWNGTPHASTSWRSGQTRSGGTYVNLTTILKGMMLIGLGMNSITNISVPSTFGGSFYQNTVAVDRPFSVVGTIHTAVASGDVVSVHNQRKTIMNALSPNLTKYKQPLLLECTELDSASSPVSETLQIKCVYEGGLEGDYKPGFAYNDQVALNFRTYVPYLTQQGEHGQVLGFQQDVANSNIVVMRTTSGVWQAMATGLPYALPGTETVHTFAQASNGDIYAGGYFEDAGDANGDYLAKWNGAAWASVGAGINSTVYSIKFAPDGSLYVGGAFTNLGDGNGDRISKWTGSAWSSLGSGAADNSVFAIAIGNDGSVYAGGSFTQMGGVANTAGIAKWNGTAWSALGTGVSGGDVRALAVDKAGNLYASGTFTLAGGVANTVKVAKWNGTAWTAMGAGGITGGDATLLAIGPDGTLYAAGTFTAAGGVAAARIAAWNGVAWRPLGSGLDNSALSMTIDANGKVLIAGYFATFSGVTYPDSLAEWSGTTWTPIDINLPGTPDINSIFYDKSGNLYLGFTSVGTAVSAIIPTGGVNSSTTAYPKIKFTGPGSTYQLKNYTTGKSIFFNLTLLAGETAVLDLDPKHVSFVSSFRGDIMNAILPGSDLSWELLPGANNVSAFMYGSTTAATAINMYWQDQYESVDQAVR